MHWYKHNIDTPIPILDLWLMLWALEFPCAVKAVEFLDLDLAPTHDPVGEGIPLITEELSSVILQT